MDISHNIKSIRALKNISQAEMARLLDLDPSAYFRVEKRGEKLSIEQLNKIAIALGVSIFELLTGEQQILPARERIKELEQENKRLDEWLNNSTERSIRLQIGIEDAMRFFYRSVEVEFGLEGKPFSEFYSFENSEKLHLPNAPYFLDFIKQYRIPLIAFLSIREISPEFEEFTELLYESMKPYSLEESKILSQYETLLEVRRRKKNLNK